MISSTPALPAISRPSSFNHSGNTGRYAALLLFTLTAIVTGCSTDTPQKGQKSSGRTAAVSVTTALCAAKDVPVTLEASGRVEASASVGIRSRINGTLDSVHFKEGQPVRKGDMLFSIDHRPYVAQVKAKEAQLAKDQAELANARKDLDRYLPASKNGYVSQAQADQAATRVATLAASVQADEAELDNARLDLEYCSLNAPISGIAGEILADEGNLIKANADSVLVTINRISPITVAFDIPGEKLAEVRQAKAKAALKVQVRPPAGGSRTLTGTLSFVDNTIDPATGTILVKADFANTDGELWPGGLVPVTLMLATRQGVPVVPSQAVQTGQDGAHVYVVRGDATVEYRQVVAGPKSDGQTVIEQGLKAGERVVTDGHLQLVDGGKVLDRSGKSDDQQGKKNTQGKS